VVETGRNSKLWHVRSLSLGAALALLSVLVRLPFFQPHATQWDAGHLAFCVSQQRMLYKPYMMTIWLGALLAHFLPADFALSLLSLVAGTLAILLFGYVVYRQTASPWLALASALVYSLAPICLETTTYQRPYALEALFLFGSLATAYRSTVVPFAVSGLLFGCAIATHTSALLVVPAFVYLWYARGHPGRFFLAWCIAGLAVALATWAWVLYYYTLSGTLPQGLHYIFHDTLMEKIRYTPATLLRNLATRARFYGTQFSGGILLLALPALIWLRVERYKLALRFWILYGLFFFLFDLRHRWPIDQGLLIVFILPGIALAAGISTVEFGRRARQMGQRNATRPAEAWAGLVLLAVALAWFVASPRSGPRLIAHAPHRHDQGRAAQAQLITASDLEDFAWLRQHIPPHAAILNLGPDNGGPELGYQPYTVAFYVQRWPIKVWRGELEYCPVKSKWGETFTNVYLNDQSLAGLMRSGLEVYCWNNADPFPKIKNIAPEKFRVLAVVSSPRVRLYKIAVASPSP
jgi:hypothetical protein